MKRTLAACVFLLVTVLALTPKAQGRVWVLVNGILQYTGLVVVNGTLTVNGSYSTPYLSDGSAVIIPWKAQASNDATKGPFQRTIGSFLFSSTLDNVMYDGYNCTAGGGRVVSGEPGYCWALEQDYEASPGTHYVESYFEYRHTDSTQKRPIFMQWNRSDGTMSDFEMRTSGITFTDWVSGATVAVLSQGGTSFQLNGNTTQSADTTLVVGALNSKAGSLNLTGNFQIRRTGTNDWAFDVGGTNAQFEIETNKMAFGGVQDYKAMATFQLRAARKDTDNTVAIKQAASQTTQALSLLDNSNNILATFGQLGAGNMDLNFASGESIFWTNSATNATATKDLGISRNAAGVLEINSGTPGTLRDVALRAFTSLKGITVAGYGVPVIVAASRVTAQSAANTSISTFTVGAADGSFEVSANMNVTASTALATTLTCTYTDESNTARTMVLPIEQLSGSFIAAGAITGTGAWETPVMHIRAKAATAITILTSAGTFTSVTYTAEGIIKQTS